MHKQFILDPEKGRQEGRTPDRRKTTLVGIKIKVEETSCNLVMTKKTYTEVLPCNLVMTKKTYTEVLPEELLNESAT